MNRAKPWPADALIIVAANAGEECNPHGHPFRDVACRDCGRELRVSESGIKAALTDPHRQDRPVAFFCVDCCVTYDVMSIDYLKDRRGITDPANIN